MTTSYSLDLKIRLPLLYLFFGRSSIIHGGMHLSLSLFYLPASLFFLLFLSIFAQACLFNSKPYLFLCQSLYSLSLLIVIQYFSVFLFYLSFHSACPKRKCEVKHGAQIFCGLVFFFFLKKNTKFFETDLSKFYNIQFWSKCNPTKIKLVGGKKSILSSCDFYLLS